MTTTNESDEIRSRIEDTQQNLSTDVDRLTDKVSPQQIVQRRVDRAKGAVSGLRAKVMGSDDNGSDSSGGAIGLAGDAVTSAPQAALTQTQGNPLAAGLIAFGTGWLLASLLPASQKEQQLAGQGKDFAQQHSDELTGPLKDVAEQMKEPAMAAAESLKSSATDSVDTVKDHAQSATGDITSQAQDAAQNVRDS